MRVSSRQRLLAITRESFKRKKKGGKKNTADKVSPTPEMQICHNGEDGELSLWPPNGPARDFQDLISPQKSIISAWQLASAQKGGGGETDTQNHDWPGTLKHIAIVASGTF